MIQTLTFSLIWEEVVVEAEEEKQGQEAQSGHCSHLSEVALEAASRGWGSRRQRPWPAERCVRPE